MALCSTLTLMTKCAGSLAMPDRILRTKTDKWYPFPEFEGVLEINKIGQVRGVSRYVNSPASGGKRLIKSRPRKVHLVRGYPVVSASRGGVKTSVSIHRAMALLFVPNPLGKPCVNHKDGNKQNFDPNNLEWCTHRENMQHAFRTGLTPYPKTGPGEDSPSAKLSWRKVRVIRERLGYGETHKSIADAFGVSKGTVGFIHRNETWVEHDA